MILNPIKAKHESRNKAHVVVKRLYNNVCAHGRPFPISNYIDSVFDNNDEAPPMNRFEKWLFARQMVKAFKRIGAGIDKFEGKYYAFDKTQPVEQIVLVQDDGTRIGKDLVGTHPTALVRYVKWCVVGLGHEYRMPAHLRLGFTHYKVWEK